MKYENLGVLNMEGLIEFPERRYESKKRGVRIFPLQELQIYLWITRHDMITA